MVSKCEKHFLNFYFNVYNYFPGSTSGNVNVYRPMEVEAHEGEDVTIECVAIGLPQPVVSWDKYGGSFPKERTETIQGRNFLQSTKFNHVMSKLADLNSIASFLMSVQICGQFSAKKQIFQSPNCEMKNSKKRRKNKFNNMKKEDVVWLPMPIKFNKKILTKNQVQFYIIKVCNSLRYAVVLSSFTRNILLNI